MRIFSERDGQLVFTPIGNQPFPGTVLPGSTILVSQNDFGSVTLQQIRTEKFSINYCIFNIVQNVTLFFEYDLPTIVRSWLLLKGNLIVKTPQKEKAELKQGQFALFNSKDIPHTITFETNKEYYVFDSNYTQVLLEPIFSAFPSLKDWSVRSTSPSKSSQPLFHSLASPEMIRIANNLIQSPYDEELRKVYFENKINDYIFEVLAQYKEEINPTVSKIVREKMYAAHSIILNDLSKHYTIKEIAVMVGISESRLKKAFPLVFNITIYDCLFRARMEKAHELLSNTDKPLKEISMLVGFDFLANFVKSFGNYFGHTPGQIRKQ